MKRFLATTSVALVTLFSRHLPAQQASTAPAAFGSPAPASTVDVEQLRKELRDQAAAHAEEMKRQADAMKRLEEALSNERTAREADRARTAQENEATRQALEKQSAVKARNFGVSITGFLQADAVAWRQSSSDEINPSTGAPLNETRFLIRRARVRTEIDYSIIGGAIEFDGNTVNGATARIIGAEASLKWRNPDRPLLPYLQLTLGLFKTPFGFEIVQSDKDRLFLERSNAERALFPGEYDLGVRLSGGWRFLRYAVGAMNGDPIGEKMFPGRDPNQSKDLVGRLGVDVSLLAKRLGLAAGFSADYGNGFHKGTPASKDTLVWRDTNEDGAVQLSEIQVIAGQTPLPSGSFERWAVGGDLELTAKIPLLGELMFYGEVVFASNLDRATQVADPLANPPGRDLRELGWYLAVTQELTPWAQIGVRYDRYDPDRDANELRDGVQVAKDQSYSTLAVTGAIRYPGYARLQMEYEHNTNPLGRSTNGLPTTLKDDAFIIRGQVQF
jgi:hypothetical protein